MLDHLIGKITRAARKGGRITFFCVRVDEKEKNRERLPQKGNFIKKVGTPIEIVEKRRGREQHNPFFLIEKENHRERKRKNCFENQKKKDTRFISRHTFSGLGENKNWSSTRKKKERDISSSTRSAMTAKKGKKMERKYYGRHVKRKEKEGVVQELLKPDHGQRKKNQAACTSASRRQERKKRKGRVASKKKVRRHWSLDSTREKKRGGRLSTLLGRCRTGVLRKKNLKSGLGKKKIDGKHLDLHVTLM